MKDAFEQIREATGISSIEETVNAFIKAEEQNYSLYNYVNNLGIKEQIERIIQRGKLNDEEKDNMRSKMTDECDSLQEQISKA
jgi:coiled-coil domain-containing protein 63/114